MVLLLPFELVLNIIVFVGIYVVINLGLNLQYGYSGVPNFGLVLAVAGGAYVVGFVPGRLASWLLGIGTNLDYVSDNSQLVPLLNEALRTNLPLSMLLFIVTISVAGLVGAGLGYISSYPAIRLREDYLAITLLAMGETLGVIGHNYAPLVGGTLGVAVPDTFSWSAPEVRFAVATGSIVIISILTLFFAERLVRSPLGRVLRAVRDSEVASESLGKNVLGMRTKTLVIGSFIASVGGALYAFYTQGVIARGYTRVDWTFWPWVMVILGGAANNLGIVFGSAAFVVARRLIIFYKTDFQPFIPFSVVWLEQILLGVTLILLLLFRPQGILPEKSTRTIGRSELKNLLGGQKSISSKSRTRQQQ